MTRERRGMERKRNHGPEQEKALEVSAKLLTIPLGLCKEGNIFCTIQNHFGARAEAMKAR